MFIGSIGAMFYRGANGCLLVYDVTNTASMGQLIKWREELVEKLGNNLSSLPIVVVANKIDLRNESSPDTTEVLNWCKDNYYGHVETSAKDNIGVAAAMNAISALAIETARSVKDNIPSESRSSSLSGDNAPKATVRLEDRFEKKKSSCC